MQFTFTYQEKILFYTEKFGEGQTSGNKQVAILDLVLRRQYFRNPKQLTLKEVLSLYIIMFN